jgi:hypothetical protein
MAKFSGPVNLQLGAGADKDGKPVAAWAQSSWDHELGAYTVDVSGEDLKKFRAVADEYGFVEDKGDKDA